MTTRLITAIVAAATALALQAATVSNAFFSLTTPDDSWAVSTDNSMRSIGARVLLQRSSGGGISELARIDVIDAPFDPESYLQSQAVERRDPFCREAVEVGEVTDTTFALLPAKHVRFAKVSRGVRYECEAVALNAGFCTLYAVSGHRSGLPNVVGAVAGSLRWLYPTAQLSGTEALVKAAKTALAKHNMHIADNEYLTHVELTDPQTLELEVMIPYLTKESVNVTAFVQQMRERWFKTLDGSYRLNLLIRAAADERKQLRYVYTDNRGGEIGTMLIYPQEYEAAVTAIKQETTKERK